MIGYLLTFLDYFPLYIISRFVTELLNEFRGSSITSFLSVKSYLLLEDFKKKEIGDSIELLTF